MAASLYEWYVEQFPEHICGLQLPREPHRSIILLQLSGIWQYDGLM